MDWSNKTALVTGAGGFIGSHLTEKLVTLGAHTRAFVRYNSRAHKGWLETSPHRSHIEFITGDIRDAESVVKALDGVDVVFHLAALIGIPYSYETPSAYVATNIGGTLNVLQAARESGRALIILTSTSEVYGSAKSIPIKETHPLQAQSPYSATKIAADKLGESFARSFNLPIITVRPFNTFGPRQSLRAIIPTIITQALTQKKILLGCLDTKRDFNYVSDTVNGFIKAGEGEAALGEVVNLGSGKDISIRALADTILEIIGSGAPIEVDDNRVRPESSEVFHLCASNEKAKELLKWESLVSLRKGLCETISWIKQNLDAYSMGSYQT